MITAMRSTMIAGSMIMLLGACSDTPHATLPNAPEAAMNRAGYDIPGMHRQYGAPQKIGEGMVRTYVVLDARNANQPIEVGVAIDAKALDGLPADMRMLHLAMPARSPEPYTFVMFDWNPDGHPPMGVYNVPHFDFHFYTLAESAVMMIDPSRPDWVSGANAWPTDIPPFYAPPTPPGLAHTEAVPMMGLHWSDIRSPELQRILPSPPGNPANWAPFDKTFIYGSWNGKLTFLEPMITLAYLRRMPDVQMTVPQPANAAVAFGKAGWYPSSYRIRYDAKAREYLIALTGLAEKR